MLPSIDKFYCRKVLDHRSVLTSEYFRRHLKVPQRPICLSTWISHPWLIARQQLWARQTLLVAEPMVHQEKRSIAVFHQSRLVETTIDDLNWTKQTVTHTSRLLQSKVGRQQKWLTASNSHPISLPILNWENFDEGSNVFLQSILWKSIICIAWISRDRLFCSCTLTNLQIKINTLCKGFLLGMTSIHLENKRTRLERSETARWCWQQGENRDERWMF